MTTIQQAIEAAVDEIRSFPYQLFSDERGHWINVVSRHVLPVVESVGKERDEANAALCDERRNGIVLIATDEDDAESYRQQRSAWKRLCSLMRRLGFGGHNNTISGHIENLVKERDTALAKLAEARGLLQRSLTCMQRWGSLEHGEYAELSGELMKFLSPSTQATEKTT